MSSNVHRPNQTCTYKIVFFVCASLQCFRRVSDGRMGCASFTKSQKDKIAN